MKSIKLGSFILSSLSIIAVCILIVSCDVFFMPEFKLGDVPQAYNSPPLSRKSELALLHTADSHETPVETLQEQVQALLQSDANTVSRSRSSVASVYSYSVTVV